MWYVLPNKKDEKGQARDAWVNSQWSGSWKPQNRLKVEATRLCFCSFYNVILHLINSSNPGLVLKNCFYKNRLNSDAKKSSTWLIKPGVHCCMQLKLILYDKAAGFRHTVHRSQCMFSMTFWCDLPIHTVKKKKRRQRIWTKTWLKPCGFFVQYLL